MECRLPGRTTCRLLFPLVVTVAPRCFKEDVMRQLRNFVQHFFNPLHVYCRLQDLGVKAPTAHRMSRAYERYLWRFIW